MTAMCVSIFVQGADECERRDDGWILAYLITFCYIEQKFLELIGQIAKKARDYTANQVTQALP